MVELFATCSLNKVDFAEGSFMYGVTLIAAPMSTRNFNLFFNATHRIGDNVGSNQQGSSPLPAGYVIYSANICRWVALTGSGAKFSVVPIDVSLLVSSLPGAVMSTIVVFSRKEMGSWEGYADLAADLWSIFEELLLLSSRVRLCS